MTYRDGSTDKGNWDNTQFHGEMTKEDLETYDSYQKFLDRTSNKVWKMKYLKEICIFNILVWFALFYQKQ